MIGLVQRLLVLRSDDYVSKVYLLLNSWVIQVESLNLSVTCLFPV